MTRIYEEERPVPSGLILEDYTDDEEIGLLKSGKEADVYLVERRAPSRSCLLAAKRYRPPEHRAFRHDLAYREHRRIDGFVRDGGSMRKRVAGRTVQKAMDQRSRYGRTVLAGMWIANEFRVLTALWRAGASVPYPVEMLEEGFLMEYVGDVEQAAPRLAQARVERAALPELFEQVRENLRLFIRAGYVHADLSAYNTLLWEDRLWFIDVPQAVPLLDNLQAMDFLHRDCVNVTTWFSRKGHEQDPEDLFVWILDEVFRYQMEDVFLAKG